MSSPRASGLDLIYDVGMHTGEDTRFYLDKGFRVVSFEADPDLVRRCEDRFRDELSDGRLTIIAGAIVDSADTRGATSVQFYRNRDVTEWGTIDPNWAERNERLGSSTEVIDVPVVDFAAVLESVGAPYYMKIDIEGVDLVCLKALRGRDVVPSYVSIESNKVSYDALRAEVALLRELGYDAFQAVQQDLVPRQREPIPCREGKQTGHAFELGASGLFGRDLPERWLAEAELMARYQRVFRDYRRWGDESIWQRSLAGRAARRAASLVAGRPLPGWFDTHARHRDVRAANGGHGASAGQI